MGNICSVGEYEEKIKTLEVEMEENNQHMQTLLDEIRLLKRENKYFKGRIDNIMKSYATKDT